MAMAKLIFVIYNNSVSEISKMQPLHFVVELNVYNCAVIYYCMPPY